MSSEWKEIPIKKAYLEFHDGPHATPKPSDVGPIYLGIKNIGKDGNLDFSEIRHISESDFQKWTKRVTPRPGDVVFTYEATLHRYAVIPQGFDGCFGFAALHPAFPGFSFGPQCAAARRSPEQGGAGA